MSNRYNYFVCYDSLSGNAYNIYYAPMGFIPPSDWTKISRQEAVSRIRLERRLRRKNDTHKGPIFMLPYDFDHTTENLHSGAFFIQDLKAYREEKAPCSFYYVKDLYP